MQETTILLIQETEQPHNPLIADLQSWGFASRCITQAEAEQATGDDSEEVALALIDATSSWQEEACTLARAIEHSSQLPVLVLAEGESTINKHGLPVLFRPYPPHQLPRLIERLITEKAVEKRYAGLLGRLQEFTRAGYWEMAPEKTSPTFSASLRSLVDIDRNGSTDGLDEFFARIHSDDVSLVRQQYAALQQGVPHHLDYRIFHRDGTLKHIRESCFLEPTADGTGDTMYGFLQDMTEEWKTRVALVRCQEEMDEFAHIASHDLQEPLRAMTGFIQLLKSRYGGQLDDKGRDFINRASRAGHRMELLIKGLLQLARISTRGAPFEPTELDAVVEKAIAGVKATAGDADVTCSRLPQLQCDSRQMTTLFRTLLDNGLKFNTSEKPRVTIDCQREGNTYHFVIEDNGIGIAEEFHHRIFTIFQRLHTEREYPGLGMGLAMAKKIVERHGGSLWVESAHGRGSAFHFTLPAAPGE